MKSKALAATAAEPLPAVFERLPQLAPDELRRGLEPGVEIDGRDDRLAGVGEQRRLATPAGLLLAAAEQQVLAETERLAQARQPPGRDQRGADLRLRAFVQVGILAVERFGDDQADDGVAEELERLVVGDAAGDVLVRARSMRQGVLEQVAIGEAMADAALERGERFAAARLVTARGRQIRAELSTSRRAASATAAGTATAISPRPLHATAGRSPTRSSGETIAS